MTDHQLKAVWRSFSCNKSGFREEKKNPLLTERNKVEMLEAVLEGGKRTLTNVTECKVVKEARRRLKLNYCSGAKREPVVLMKEN